MIRVLVIDDHEIVRIGIQRLVEDQRDIEIVGNAVTAAEGLEAAHRLKPDVAIIDLKLPDMTGLDVIRRLTETQRATCSVVVSIYDDDQYVTEALRLGAAGYVLKEAGAGEIIRAIREAAGGRRYLSPPLPERAIEAYMRSGEPEQALIASLTPRERDTLTLLGQGLGTAEVAERLSISPRTAEKHRANGLKKLGLKSQAQLVRFAHEKGLAGPKDPPLSGNRAEAEGS
jgi:two-component system, NarL family, response regulator NreC